MSLQRFVLIVEDDDELREQMRTSLRKAGFLVFEASSFRQALDELAVTPHLMVLDIHLTDATGWDVAEWMEQYGIDIPIIVTSGTSTPTEEQMAYFRASAFLPKPYSMARLVELARDLTSGD